MFISETKIKVRYVETDQMGVVHHSKYYPWFEIARGDFFDEGDLNYADMERNGIFIPVFESSCRYKQPAKYPDDIIIKAWIEELTPVKGIFAYEVIRENDNILLAQGKTGHAFVNKEFKPINLKKMRPEIWDKLHDLSANKNAYTN